MSNTKVITGNLNLEGIRLIKKENKEEIFLREMVQKEGMIQGFHLLIRVSNYRA